MKQAAWIGLALFIAGLTTGSANAEALDVDREQLETCSNTESLIARVSCYDDLANHVLGTIKSEEVIDQAAMFGRDVAKQKAQLQASIGVVEADAIEANVTGVGKTAYGKLLVSLDNGQVWRQIDSARLPLGTGEGVSIERAGLGSFMLEKAGGSRTIRVRRVD